MTETSVTFGKADELGYNPAGGKWVVVCQRHEFVLNVNSRDRAREAAKNTSEWCDECREMDQETPEDVLSDVVTFSTTQTDAVTDEQFESMDTMLQESHAQWLAEEHAKQADSHVEPEEVVPQPILGTYLIDDVAHHAISVSGMYIKSVCKPESAHMAGEQVDANDERLCTYCMAGILAPAKEETERKRRGRPPKAVAPPEPPAEPRYTGLTEALLAATAQLVAAIEDDPSVPDVVTALSIMAPAVDTLRKHAPRRRSGVVTGARSGLVKQSKTVNPSAEVKCVQTYADAGDKRAQDIIKHVDAYVAGEDCAYCLDKGRSTRHGYATAFMSIGRELTGMETRTGIPLPEDIKAKISRSRAA